MRKKIVVGLIIMFFIIIFNNKTYAKVLAPRFCLDLHSDKLSEPFLWDILDVDSVNHVLSELHNVYGYEGTEIYAEKDPGTNTMEFKTTIYILNKLEPRTDPTLDKPLPPQCEVQIGGGAADKNQKTGTLFTLQKTETIREDVLEEQYGYKPGVDSWNVVLHGSAVKEDGFADKDYYKIEIRELYTEDETPGVISEGIALDSTDITRVSEAVAEAQDTLDDVTDIIGNLHMKLYEIKLMPFDAIQSVIDMLQTVNYGGSKRFLPWKIVYPGEDIQSDSNKNQYVNYTTGSDDLGKDGQKVAFINEKESGLKINKISEWIFGAKPQIPVIPIDMYALAKGKVEIFDINFLTGQNNKDLHPDNSVWLIIRNFISAVIHVILYLGASILIIMLVLHGISLVKEAIIAEQSSPEERKKHIGGIHEMTIAFIKLLGCVLIMGICIFVSDAVFEDMKVTDKMELPIRVNVGSGAKDGSGNQYSFSTNIIGYVRFMANICDPDYVGFKALYTWGYIILVVINVALILVMFIRLIAIILLSLAGPIIAVAGVFNRKELFGLTYQEWAKHYAIWASIQLVFAIIYRILLNVCFSN